MFHLHGVTEFLNPEIDGDDIYMTLTEDGQNVSTHQRLLSDSGKLSMALNKLHG